MLNDQAVALNAAGLDVFPCTNEKAPAIPKGTDWRDIAKLPINNITWNRSGIVGVPIPPNVLVLDLDTYKGVTRQDVETLLGCSLSWDNAFIQRTQNGGEHYAFFVDWPAKQGSNIAKLEGFDTRTAGEGYIATGKGYTPTGYGVFAMSHPAQLPRLPQTVRRVLEKIDQPPREEVALPTGDKDVDTIKEALGHLDPGCGRTEWLRVGLALRHHFHDDPETGLQLFDAWSRGSLGEYGEPGNYDGDSMDHQWGSFKPIGGVTIATLFYSAIESGYKPPAGEAFDTSEAFAPSETFDTLVDRIEAQGGNPKSTNDLINEVNATPCNGLQKGILLATLHRELKDAGLLTAKVKATLDGKKEPGQPVHEYAKNHTMNATIFIDSKYPDSTLRRYDHSMYRYNGKVWEELEEDELKHEVALELAPTFPQHSTVSGTASMVESLTGSGGAALGNMPPNLIVMQNGVLDFETRRLKPHSMKYFTTSILPYEHLARAQAPHWEQFLDEIFEGDQERIALLQEWFGYLIGGSYEFHKIMLLLGPRRSGKGTIGRILKILVGPQNYEAGTLASFADSKYLESIQNKHTVFIGDAAKTVARNIVDVVTERIKGISGNDDQSFARLYRKSASVPIPARITVSTNSIPKLFDDSGALSSRMLVLPFNVSWYNREDLHLSTKLIGEIEGICQWSLKGLARLRSNGRFTVPAASRDEAEFIEDSYSPLGVFLRTVCIIGGDNFESSESVYDAYKMWAFNTEEDSLTPRRPFISSFKDMTRGTGVTYGSHRVAGVATPVRGFKGITLRPQAGAMGATSLTRVK